jgi:hypothetical protein
MTTTTPTHGQAEARVSVGRVPAPRPAPTAGMSSAVATTPRPAITATPTPVAAVPATLPRQRSLSATPPVLPLCQEAVAVASVTPARVAPGRMVQLRRQCSASLSEFVALMTIGVVATAGAVFVLVTTAVPAPRTPPALPASVSPNVSVPGRVLTAFGDGVWQVGVDIEPGTYASTGSVAGATCQHALRTARSGGDVTTTTAPAGPMTVVLTADDNWFATSGCATWKRAS